MTVKACEKPQTRSLEEMSEYENVVGGKLRLKGRALEVKTGGINKKKKKQGKHNDRLAQAAGDDPSTGGNTALLVNRSKDTKNEMDNGDGKRQGAAFDDHLTPAERRYLQQWEKLDLQRMAKMASKSHRDRIHEFNQYLANLTEHYDIPKVGPG